MPDRRLPDPTLPARDHAELRVARDLEVDGCVLCLSRVGAEERFIDALVGEAVNDIGVRRRLDAAGGYCARHASLLPVRERARRGGTLGSTILLSSVLRGRLDAVDEAAGSSGRRLRGRTEGLRRPPACPLCRDVDGAVVSVLTVLFGRLADPLWVAALSRSPLCLDDLLLLWDSAAQGDARLLAAWRPVAAAQSARLRALVTVADAYIAHSAHDRHAELTDEERAAADAIVAVLAPRLSPD